METRNEKFRRLAELRLTRVFQNMNSIANLSAPKYKYTEAEISDLFETYQKLGVECREYFKGPSRFNEMPSTFKFTAPDLPDDETSVGHDRFRYLAENRMTQVVQFTRKLASLSVKSNYTYTKEEVNELFDAYEQKGHEVESLFLPLTEEFHFKPKD
ncbi:hypothetical protein [Companilactobacillus ginsenosidimutans]|uniref:Uncharacterized protein n=1 Tax=Companilactobacillus ginsenosidimutans TaxID=1007676 RepID=A0A0H4QL86_9LACO|nr:hypothetical protein [Companilactobacillus ginsenosidimutans]AKP67463.1 hypothetical protein ABM34_07925 [Companilactobacillus ginsenosidimutans]